MRKTGFTLIEILIVVVLLGILAAVVVPNLADSADEAKQKAELTDLDTLRFQIQLYRVKTDSYPKKLKNLVPDYLPLIPTPAYSGGDWSYSRSTGVITHDTSSW
jgi:general secretion pathway protein G